ncbi:MAG: exopolysaccharide biosynthesis polyprenyl glycosylphosphotransferase [Candidatus Binataceae bacterium]
MFAGELRKQKACFAAADSIALFAAFAGALCIHDPAGAMESRLLDANRPLLALTVIGVAALWVLVFRACDLYRMRAGGLKESLAIVKACSIAAMLTLLGVFLAHIEVSRLAVVLAYLLSIPAVMIGRGVARACIRRFYANPKIAIPLAIVGYNPVAHYLFDQILDEMTPYEPVGFLDFGACGRQYRGYPVVGAPSVLTQLANVYPGLEVAIAMPDASREHQEEIIRICESRRVRWWMVPWMLRSLATGLKVDMLGAVPLLGPRGSNIEGLNLVVKRAFDVTAALFMLIGAAPVLAVAALAIWLDDGRPILFRQVRIGIHGQPFELLKLRTMRRAADDRVHREYVRHWIREGAAAANAGNGNGGTNGNANGRSNGNARPIFKLVRDNRITAIGRVLRRLSIDELPQLINVVRGEMSLIGPRPALPYEIDFYQEWHRRRLDAAPGITGLWQVSGRNRVSFDEMVRLDVQYLEDWSLTGDLRILARTVPALLRGEGM